MYTSPTDVVVVVGAAKLVEVTSNAENNSLFTVVFLINESNLRE